MNLFHKYKLLTESTENFKKWFGKSTLHDSGKPHTYYHGTGDDIKAFSHEHIGKGTDAHGSGFYFTNKPETANHYAGTKDDKHPNVIPVHLNVSKPIHHDSEEPFKKEHIHKLITSAPNHKESLENHGDVPHEGYHKVLSAAVNAYSSLPKAHAIGALHNDFYHNNASELLKNVTKITGHDGIIVKNGDHHIVNVFHPNQIKSAIGNKGTYSKKSDDITENLFSKYMAILESAGHDKPHGGRK